MTERTQLTALRQAINSLPSEARSLAASQIRAALSALQSAKLTLETVLFQFDGSLGGENAGADFLELIQHPPTPAHAEGLAAEIPDLSDISGLLPAPAALPEQDMSWELIPAEGEKWGKVIAWVIANGATREKLFEWQASSRRRSQPSRITLTVTLGRQAHKRHF